MTAQQLDKSVAINEESNSDRKIVLNGAKIVHSKTSIEM